LAYAQGPQQLDGTDRNAETRERSEGSLIPLRMGYRNAKIQSSVTAGIFPPANGSVFPDTAPGVHSVANARSVRAAIGLCTKE